MSEVSSNLEVLFNKMENFVSTKTVIGDPITIGKVILVPLILSLIHISGEIDIIAKKGETIVFVEVKFRTNTEKGLPREAVNYRKQKHIQNTALCYLKYKNCMESDIRFDVIEILNFKITHIKNAF